PLTLRQDFFLLCVSHLPLPALLERLLVEHADQPPRALVHDDLLLPELPAGRRHAVPPAELAERDLEDPAEEVPERVLRRVPLDRGLRAGALRAHAVPRGRVRPAVPALEPEPLRHVH